MAKIILEFNSEEEANDARVALDGYKWKLAMWDLDQKLRSATKYAVIDNREATPEEQDMADKVREFIRDILNDYHLNLEE
jgi:hypothetical protein